MAWAGQYRNQAGGPVRFAGQKEGMLRLPISSSRRTTRTTSERVTRCTERSADLSEAKDTTSAAQAYGQFARRYPTDTRANEARAFRVTLLRAAGDSAAVNADLAVLCASTPPDNLKADCAKRAGRAAFTTGVSQYQAYRPIKLVIASRARE